MIIVKIATVGKTKESWLKEAIHEYEKRLSHDLKIEWILTKDQNSLEELVSKESNWIYLDVSGNQLSTPQLAQKWEIWKREFNSRISFTIAGDLGWSKQSLTTAHTSLSLSLLTFTHQMCRLVLIEQIYRCEQIAKGSSYHK